MTISASRVKETTTSTGVGPVTLAGAETGFRTFADALTVGPGFPYAMALGAQFEVGTGYLSDATTLVRDTVLASSNGGALVNFAPGTKEVFCSLAGEQITAAGYDFLAAVNAAAQRTVLGLGTLATQSGTYGNVNAADAAADTTTWPLLAGSQTGDQQPLTDANFTYDASTNTVTFGSIIGSALEMTIQPKAPTVLEDAGTLRFIGSNAVKANSNGGSVEFLSGSKTGSGQAGLVSFTAGTSGVTLELSQSGFAAVGAGGDSFTNTNGNWYFAGPFGGVSDQSMQFWAGYNIGFTGNSPIEFYTDSGLVFEVGETTFGTQELAFFGAALTAKPTGVAVTAAGIHAALVTLGLIAA